MNSTLFCPKQWSTPGAPFTSLWGGFFLLIYFFNISIQKNSPILAEIKISLQSLQHETTHPFLLMQVLIEKDS
jgi:hypothetical protein